MVHTECGDDRADLVARVVEEYFQRLRRGEHPQLEEFVEQYPEISDVLKTVIPGLQVAEQATDGKVSHERHKQLGDFRILRQIGRGGMGIVYEAEQISMNRRVALKVLPLAGLVDDLKIRRFQNEVRAVAALDHPNIVSVYMVGEERGVHYYAMQLIRGRSLSEVVSSLRHVRDEGKEFDGSSISQITSMGRVDDRAEADLNTVTEFVGAAPPHEVSAETVGPIAKANSSTIPHSSRREYYRSVAALGIHAASALQHAHDQGVVHRDIKPANLLLDSASKLYVTDFGLARIESDAGVTMSGDLVGTLRYMAPEQALAKRIVVDHRADIYSLAATLYELLTLRPAYLAEDRQQLLRQIAFEEPALLRRIDRDIPAELETIVHKAMAKDMDQRYASAQELADDLRSHLENRPIQAKPPTTSEIIGKWTRRNPILTWSAIITLSLVTLTLVTSVLFISSQRDIARQMAETRRQELYVAQINLAHQAWIDGDFEQAQMLLASQRPLPDQTDLRGFEWRQLWQHCQDESHQTLGMLTDGPEEWWGDGPGLSFSADEGKLAIADGKIVRMWDFANRRELPPVAPHAKSIRGVVFSPTNPGLLATADVEGAIRLWDLASKAPPSAIAKDMSVTDLAFSPDGNKLASASFIGGWVTVWDVETRCLVWKKQGHRDEEGHAGDTARPALCVTFSPDGELVASGGGDTEVRLWNAVTGEEEPPLEGHTAYVLGLDFSRDGRFLASCAFDSRVLLWDLATRRALPELLGHEGLMFSVAFSPDSKTLASGGADRTIRFWSVATLRQTNMLRGHTNGVKRLAFSPDGRWLVSASDETVRLWDALPHRSQDVLTEHEGWVEALALSPDGDTLVTSDYHTQSLKLWDIPSHSSLGNLHGHTGVPNALAFSPKGKFLASGGRDKTVRLWDLGSREPTTLRCEFPIESVTFSSDGKILGAAGKGLKFWNVASGREVELIKEDTRSVEHVAFSPKGRLLVTADKDGPVVVWDVNNAKKGTPFRDEIKGITSLTFSSEGQLIAVGQDNGRIALFDVAKPENVRWLQGHTAMIRQVAFTPDSKTLASASDDSTVRLWNIATGQPALTVKHLGPATGVCFSNDGMLMATCGADGTARLWLATSLSEADASLRTMGNGQD